MGHNATSPVELATSLANRGLWDEFQKAKTALEAKGIPSADAHDIAARDILDSGGGSDSSDELCPEDFPRAENWVPLDDVEWVYLHHIFKPSQIDRNTVPSSGAWGLYLDVRKNGAGEFFKAQFRDMVKARAAQQERGVFNDDGNADLAQIERVRRMAESEDE